MNQRFPFGRFKIEEWSIEHIHPQNCEELKNDKEEMKNLLKEFCGIGENANE